MNEPARSAGQRKRDTLRLLEDEIDGWVATAGPDGGSPYLVPLSFLWDGSTILIATAAATPTSRNLVASGKVRIGIGHPRDVVLVEGMVRVVAAADIPAATGDAFAAKTGFDPRTLTSAYLYFHIVPVRLQAWREENELAGRELIRDGQWTV